MLGTHNSFTFLKSNWFNELFSSYWRCQNKNIGLQYNLGVRFFDIRIKRNKKRKWVICHGSISFNQYQFNTIYQLCYFIEDTFRNLYYRIILENNKNNGKELFKQEIIGIEKRFNKLVYYAIKKPWICLYDNRQFETKAYNCCLFNWQGDKSFLYNIKHLRLNQTIKKWARKNNPKISENIIINKNILYFIDYL